jgi:hypothetical protein
MQLVYVKFIVFMWEIVYLEAHQVYLRNEIMKVLVGLLV